MRAAAEGFTAARTATQRVPFPFPGSLIVVRPGPTKGDRRVADPFVTHFVPIRSEL